MHKTVQRKKKYAITLLEIMIVILLIGMIGGVVGYNVKSSLDKGKAFKTEFAIKQIQEILLLEMETGTSADAINKKPIQYIKKSNLCKNQDALLKDGWGGPYTIEIVDGEVEVFSENLEKYKQKQSGEASGTKKATK